jgi:hypothetical protein
LSSGYTQHCVVAQNGETAFMLLRAVYPLAGFACLTALVAAVLNIFSGRWRRMYRLAVGLLITAMLLCALGMFGSNVTRALAALDGVNVGVGGSLGTMLVAVAVLLSLALASEAYDDGRGLVSAAALGAGPDRSSVCAMP